MFLEIYRISTRVEGGENRGSDLFARKPTFTEVFNGKPTIDNRLSGRAAQSTDSRRLLQVSIIRTICLQQANGLDYLFIWIHRKIRNITKQIEKSSVFHLNSFSI